MTLPTFLVHPVYTLFWTLSGISPANRRRSEPKSVYTTHAQVKGRHRWRNFGRDRLSGGEMGGSKVSPTPRVFCKQYEMSLFSNFATADFRQIWPRHVNREWNADFGQKFIKSFHSGVIFPQKPKLGGGQTCTPLRAGYRSRGALQRDTVYSTLLQGPGSFRGRSTFLYNVRLRSYGASNCTIFGFWPIFPIQNA